MKRCIFIAVIALVFACFVELVRISLNEKALANEVSQAVRTNEVVVRLLGDAIKEVRGVDQHGRFFYNFDGSREGVTTVDVVSERMKLKLKVEWLKPAGAGVEISRILRPAPFKQDELLWEEKHH